MEDIRRSLKEAKSRFKSDSKIKQCFHFNTSECNGKIKNAHSLQKNGVLSILEHEINKNKVVYSFLHPRSISIMAFDGFEPLGKNECSTFHGFCDYHDSSVFSPIENNDINVDLDEHCFLLCYRAFAKEYHAKIEVNKGYKINEIYNLPQNKEVQEDLIGGSDIAIRDLENVKIKLNKILEDKNYSNLDYLTYTIPYTIPIACSASITPSYSYSGKLLNKSADPNDVYENIMITVIPTSTETHIILGCFSEDQRSLKYINELEQLEDDKFEIAITSILIGDIENTFISPLIWQRMTKNERKILMEEISLTSPLYMTMFEDSFFLSRLNLFSPKFLKK